ncbi:hypothetical protein LCGC14_0894870 [marine sediment metagenome]|uniref:Uncharacterized protein n=1 Tax=marine sediment metagenome TaxID=412755 RepID=A0A0F9PIV8_9ZZZZ
MALETCAFLILMREAFRCRADFIAIRIQTLEALL